VLTRALRLFKAGIQAAHGKFVLIAQGRCFAKKAIQLALCAVYYYPQKSSQAATIFQNHYHQ
jgi:hypothetical protein